MGSRCKRGWKTGKQDPIHSSMVYAPSPNGGPPRGGPRRGVSAAAPARLHIGRSTPSHTRTCPGPPRSSPAPHAQSRPRGPAGRPGRQAGRWPPGPRHTRVVPWGSQWAAPGLPPVGALPPRAASGPERSRSHGGRGHCRSAGLQGKKAGVTTEQGGGLARGTGEQRDREGTKGGSRIREHSPTPPPPIMEFRGGTLATRGTGEAGWAHRALETRPSLPTPRRPDWARPPPSRPVPRTPTPCCAHTASAICRHLIHLCFWVVSCMIPTIHRVLVTLTGRVPGFSPAQPHRGATLLLRGAQPWTRE